MAEGLPIASVRENSENFREKEIRSLIEELSKPLLKILENLRPDVESGSYKVILGDDGSGRIPALILAKAINTIYATKGHDKALIRFVAGGRHLRSRVGQSTVREQMLEQMARIGTDAEMDMTEVPSKIVLLFRRLFPTDTEGVREKVLIVTDTIGTGKPTRFLVEAFAANGIKADVATLGIVNHHLDSGLDRENIGKRVGTKVIDGELPAAPRIYAEKDLSGVKSGKIYKPFWEKTDTSQLGVFAQSRKKYDLESFEEKSLQADINFARKILGEVADTLADNYLADTLEG